VPQAVKQLFKSIKSLSATKDIGMAVSFLEIYMDQIRDLGLAY
jgi:hypothetical protein